MKKYSPIQNLMFLYKEAWEFKKSLLIFLFLEVLFGVVTPLLGAILPSRIIYSIETSSTLKELVQGIVIIFLVYGVLQFISTYLTRRNSMQYITIRNQQWWNNLMQTCMTMDYQKSETKEIGEVFGLAAEANNSNNMGLEGAFHNSTVVFTSVLSLLVYLIILSNVNWWIVMILFALSLISFAIYYFCRKKYNQVREELSENDIHLRYYSQLAYKADKGKDIRLFSLSGLLDKKHILVNQNNRKLCIKREGYMFYFYLVIELISCLRDFICYGYLIYLLIQNSLSISDFVLYLSLISGISSMFIDISINVVKLWRDLDMVSDYRYFLSQSDDFDKGIDFSGQPIFDIIFDHVTFKYPNTERKILDDFSLRIKSGEKVALVGVNGAGKTTIVKLLCGLYHPTSGRILINGIDLEEISRNSYSKCVGAVFQDTSVFSFSIGENVSGLPEGEYDEELVVKALERAGLYDYVSNLPKGIHQYLNKDVEEDGVSLSGGQYQRLFLAKVLYRNPKLMIMDEPTAALDAISEKEMYEKYNEITEDKTSLFISHRLASTRFCDRIILLENGKIVEEGTHEELIAKKDKYFEMFEVQSKYYREGGEVYEENLAEC